MIAPDGSTGDIPQERVADALRAGGKVAVDMLSPDGTPGLIPLDHVHEAIKAGGQLAPKLQPPKLTMDTPGPEAAGKLAHLPFVNPHTPTVSEGLSDTALAGTPIAAGAVGEAIPSVLPATIAGVKAVGAWASRNPVPAYILYKILFEHSAITRFIKGMPTPAPDE